MYRAKDLTVVRSWYWNKNDNVDFDTIMKTISDGIEALEYPSAVYESTVDAKAELNNPELPVVVVSSKENSKYMNIVYLVYNDNSNIIVEMAANERGEQVKARDLEKLYQKVQGSLSGIYHSYQNGKNTLNRWGLNSTAGSLGVGAGVAIGAVVGGSVRLAIKGINILLRDKEAYEKEMDYYLKLISMSDFLLGGNDTDDVITKIELKARKENPLAQYILANAYAEGTSIKANLDKAVYWYEKAADNGEKRSREILAYEFLFGETDYDLSRKHKGIVFLTEMADDGNEDAINSLIDIYGKGSVRGINADIDKTVELAEKYSQIGNKYSIMTLALIYDSCTSYNNVDTRKYEDDSKAFAMYLQAVNFSNSKDSEYAAISLAKMCWEGRGTEKNQERTVNYYKVASEMGNVEAKAMLAYCNTFGLGTEKNYAEAKKYADAIIKRNATTFVPMAYYCNYIIADEAKKYKDSMEYARKYLACNVVDEEKMAELQAYLDEKEALISTMTDEQRMEYLQEKKSLFYNLRKSISDIFGRKKEKKLKDLKRYDVITFDENDKVVVLERCDFNNRRFVYVNEILPDESDVTDVYKVMEIHLEDGSLEKVVDTQLLKELMPRFQKLLEAYLTPEEKLKAEQNTSNMENKVILMVKDGVIVGLKFNDFSFEKNNDEEELSFVNRAKRIIESKTAIDFHEYFTKQNVVKVYLDKV